MDKLNRWLIGLILAFGVIGMASLSQAANYAKSPKKMSLVSYTTAVSSITTMSVLQSTSGLTFPGAVYQVIVGSGAAQDFCVLYDTTTFTGCTAPSVLAQSLTCALTPRLYANSTSQSTIYTFDPPILFYTGLMAGCISATDSMGITFEEGRGLSGN